MSLNVKEFKKNAYRITKDRGVTALRVRVPGGHLEAKYLTILQEIAETYGDGNLHITTRQGFEITGIPMTMVEEVNKKVAPLIEGMEAGIGVDIGNPEDGYPAAGTRNVSACIGNKVCRYAKYNTTKLAQRIEKNIFPNDYHVKIAVSGCQNDCIKAHMQDFGVLGMDLPVYDAYRCISCGACVKNCQKRATGALEFKNYKVVRDEDKCIGCGECIAKCPTNAWTRDASKKYYKLLIMGRTGKRNPRLAMPFLEWVTEDAIIDIINKTYDYVDEYIDRSLPKEHVGYIVDRTGFQVFKDYVLDGVELNPECRVAEHIDWPGYKTNVSNNFKKVGK
ncbi:anaerobic sulfite reductase subunit C [Orenia metallireducens]|uniref:Anaerobic sulfite reductase subunit C n=1 Tax=Orenia metallireducens TaxID=1413210 RepID=A0A285IEN9_9FIRM|nr:sulfite reductase subunit C [Orenia metallireducens]PRX28037.1 anaerobic sulfite reductase subunit C [Orenia metallireducens]SNY45536.1 anaerobic sulfite reductase subunit C [Orenia metallireducens]